MKSTTKVKKWGNSFAIRVPKSVIQNLGLAIDSELEIVSDDEKAIVKPIAARRQSLEDLLKGVTPENVQGEYNWGEPVGKEVW